MDKTIKIDAKWIKIALAVAGAVVVVVLFYPQAMVILSTLTSACVIAFILAPLCELLQRVFRSRGVSVALALLSGLGALALLIWLLVPPILRQFQALSQLMGVSMGNIQRLLGQLNELLAARELPPIDLSRVDWSWLTDGIVGVLSSGKDIAGSVISWAGQFAFALMLAVYFLLYQRRVLLSLELMVPSGARKIALMMAANVVRELRQYLKGQFTIALIVGVLSSVGLWIVGAPSPAMLGAIVGVFNLIPYFGPLIGAIPAVLMALGQGLQTATLTALVLFIVQQLDGFLIGPRVMSGMMGLSPVSVLLAITVGSSVSGVSGMFFAIPVLLIVRICLRVWASRNEMIEMHPEM